MIKRSALLVGIILGFGLISTQAEAQNCDLDYGWLGCGSTGNVSLWGCDYTGLGGPEATKGAAQARCREDIDAQTKSDVSYYCEDCIHPPPDNCEPIESDPFWGHEPYTYRCTQDSGTGQWTCACSIEGNQNANIDFHCTTCAAP